MGNGKEEELPPISGYWQRGNSSYAFLNETRVTVGVHQSRQESILDSNQVGQLLSLKRSKTHHWKRISFQLPCNLHLICFFFSFLFILFYCVCVCVVVAVVVALEFLFTIILLVFLNLKYLLSFFFYHLLLGAKRIDRLRFFSFFLSFLLLSFPGCCCCCCFGCCCCCCCCCWISSASFTFTTCCSSCCSSCCCWEKEGRRAVDKKNGLTEFSMNSNIAGEKMVGAALHER